MNKKIIFSSLFVLLAIIIVALIAFGSKGSKDSVSSAEDTNSQSTEVSSEENTTPGIADSIFDDITEDSASTKDETKSPSTNKNEGSVKPNNSAEASSKPNANTENSNKPDSETTNSNPSESKPTNTESSNSSVTSKPVENPSDVKPASYEDFIKMSASEQKTYVDSFSDIDAFFNWYNAAKEAYEKANPSISVDKENIDIGDIIEDKD